MDAQLVLAKLSRMGYRITRQRTLVVEQVLDCSCLQSAEEIYSACRRQDGNISVPTIYRTLEMLVEAGLVRKLHFGQGKSWFEPLRPDGEHHHHLVCRECGMRQRITSCPHQLIAREAVRNNFVVLDHQFEILGLCCRCRPEKEVEK